MAAPAHILIVDDLPDNAALLRKMLVPEGHQFTLVARGQAALDVARTQRIDLILLDVMLPDLDGMEVTRLLKADAQLRYIPILLITARADRASLVRGLDAGADDYLVKPVERQELLARVRAALRTRQLQQALLQTQRELEEKNHALETSYQELMQRTAEKIQLQAEVGELRRQVGGTHRLRDMIGRSAAMQRVFEQITLAAPSDITVMVRGETGTGKELVARAIHQESSRSSGPFVALNCGAVPEGLLESELFGHEKGAFTGALTRKIGRFERAAGGTLFLDELGDIPKAMQVKLLRVLQEREFERVGGSKPMASDVRIIAATHKNLETLVASQEFRQDLYYRLNVFPIDLPPLRARQEDIPALAQHLLNRIAAARNMPSPEITRAGLEQLMAHPWPGNVRELENTLERSLLLSGGRPLSDFGLAPAGPRGAGVSPLSLSASTGGGGLTPVSGSVEVPSLDESLPFKTWKGELLAFYERRYIISALRRHDGNMAAAARETEVDAKTFARKIAEYNIKRREFLSPEALED